jgi:hypothetical protein
MKRLVLIICIFTNILLFADGTKNQDKILKLKKTPGPIKIDGIIDAAWNQADSVSDFIQLSPYFGKQPSKGTTIKVLTSDQSIFVLFKCYDEPENITRNTGKQDDFSGDGVSFMIDTFNDLKTAYKFAVSAGGARADCRLLDDARNYDWNWDGIWFSDARIYNWGYVVEMEIPFKSIQYDEKQIYWGLDFDRSRAVNNEELSWCNYIENEGQRISKFGRLIFDDFRPSTKGLNLEIYPVGLSKIEYNTSSDKYKFTPTVGLDVFYNPSPQLTLQATANPDFAQIEADPYNFNISRYESYFSERRPFFTQGNEIFMASGKERNSGFYQPLELFYSRRIGKKLSDGTEVPLTFGAKAFGRLGEFEYGGFFAKTAETDYSINSSPLTEPSALFASARIKKQIFGNSQIGMLFVGKQTKDNTYGIIDIDGAFRGDDWQLAYQIANAFKSTPFNSDSSDYAVSVGYRKITESLAILSRGRYVGNNFDANEIGYVPWKGTISSTTLIGPRWYFGNGYVREIILFGGYAATYEKIDSYTDFTALICMDMNFRDNWGYEFVIDIGKSRDMGIEYNNWEITLSSWFNMSPNWNANFQGGYSKTYNFARNYLGGYSWFGGSASWKATKILEIGANFNSWIEINPDKNIDEITYNTRPYFSLTPLNDLNIRMYADNVFLRSSNRIERVIVGFLFSYQFSPKSWLYLAINEIQDRSPFTDKNNQLILDKMNIRERAGVFKIKYLYYF